MNNDQESIMFPDIPSELIPQLMTESNTAPTMHKMEIDDFQLVRQWCIDEGWNLGLDDIKIYHKVDPEGHFLFLNTDNEPLGSLSLVRHSKNFFSIGPFIVKKEYRNKGYGGYIWDQALQRLNLYNNPSIILYAVAAQVYRYKQLGFQIQYVNQRWQLNENHTNTQPSPFKCMPITTDSIKKIHHYDKEVFSASREKALLQILKNPGVKGFLVEDNTYVTGFGFIRPCIKGYRIGPLIADSSEIAKCIIQHLIRQLLNVTIIIDSPAINYEAIHLMNNMHAKRVPEMDTVAMTKGGLPNLFERNIKKHYAIFSLETG